MDPVLSIRGLRTYYRDQARTVKAVDGVDLDVRPGTVLSIVGESGCGKTTLALSILKLLPGNGFIPEGRVEFEGHDLLALHGEALRTVRGRRIAMIFQDPVSGLNPVISIGTQVAEIIHTHLDVPKQDAQRMTVDALRSQGLPNPENIAASYPYNLSGGMCQRVMIAMATVLKPAVIVADEPTSALDVTMQAAILHELDELRQRTGTAILLITHDLGVVATIADEVAVMYAGRIVEHGATFEVYKRPQHPYTAALLAARPRLDDPGRKLTPIKGAPPDLAALPPECAYLPRCVKAVNACRTDPWPALRELQPAHVAACYNPVFHPED
jgi:peptide/nickel transport system ATP-binding protein/oligopeptide transport system ATP-binding protein